MFILREAGGNGLIYLYFPQPHATVLPTGVTPSPHPPTPEIIAHTNAPQHTTAESDALSHWALEHSNHTYPNIVYTYIICHECHIFIRMSLCGSFISSNFYSSCHGATTQSAHKVNHSTLHWWRLTSYRVDLVENVYAFIPWVGVQGSASPIPLYGFLSAQVSPRPLSHFISFTCFLSLPAALTNTDLHSLHTKTWNVINMMMSWLL